MFFIIFYTFALTNCNVFFCVVGFDELVLSKLFLFSYFFTGKPDLERLTEQLIRASKFGVILDAKNVLEKGCNVECLGIQVSFLRASFKSINCMSPTLIPKKRYC